MENSRVNFLSTKFIMGATCLVMVYIAFMMGKVSEDVFMPFMLGILGIFTGGNVVSKFSNTNSTD